MVIMRNKNKVSVLLLHMNDWYVIKIHRAHITIIKGASAHNMDYPNFS